MNITCRGKGGSLRSRAGTRSAAPWDSEGIAFFGVANVGEARRISQAGCRTGPISWVPPFRRNREEIVLNGWRSFISTIEEAVHYNSLARLYGKTLPIHISVDTGHGPRRIPAGPA